MHYDRYFVLGNSALPRTVWYAGISYMDNQARQQKQTDTTFYFLSEFYCALAHIRAVDTVLLYQKPILDKL